MVPGCHGCSSHARSSRLLASGLLEPGGYARRVPTQAQIQLFLTAFAIGGILYVCLGSGVFDKENTNWWGSLPKHKQAIVIGAIAATLLQTFL
jgi:hypothetical protein